MQLLFASDMYSAGIVYFSRACYPFFTQTR